MEAQPNNLPRPTTTSSRPGTAQRRPKTAGRNAERPPISAVQPERPASRRLSTTENNQIGVVAAETPIVEAASNLSNVSPTTPFSLRVSSRGGTASSNAARAQLTTASFVPNAQVRPTTQQGFIAQRPQTRLGTGMGRQIADKTYFLGLLNTQLNMLNKEIDSLSTELARAVKEQQNLLIYEQRAEQQANEIKQLQNQLADYNLIIDRQNTSANDMKDLEFEVFEEQKRTSDLTSTVEELFKERRDVEEQCKELEQQVNEVKRQNTEFLNNLDSNIKAEYEEAKLEAEHLRVELDEKQSELNQLNKTKEDLDFQMTNSPLKQQAMFLQEQISELEVKKKALLDEMNNEGSPEDQRKALIDQINANNNEIQHIQQQTNELNEQLSVQQEELREFENEFEIIAGEKNERYRDLKIKEKQLDDFLGSFDVTKMETERILSENQVEIVRLLRLISINCQRDEINVTELDESAIGIAIRNNTSASELQELHVRLQEEKIGLDEAEARMNAELESIKREQNQRHNESGNLPDFEKLKERTINETKELTDRASELSIKLASKENECAELSSQLSDIIQRLSQSPHFPKLRDLRRRLEIAEEERKELQTQLDSKLAEVDYQELKTKSLRLRQELNQLLIEAFSK